jgi:hypothetical protein
MLYTSPKGRVERCGLNGLFVVPRSSVGILLVTLSWQVELMVRYALAASTTPAPWQRMPTTTSLPLPVETFHQTTGYAKRHPGGGTFCSNPPATPGPVGRHDLPSLWVLGYCDRVMPGGPRWWLERQHQAAFMAHMASYDPDVETTHIHWSAMSSEDFEFRRNIRVGWEQTLAGIQGTWTRLEGSLYVDHRDRYSCRVEISRLEPFVTLLPLPLAAVRGHSPECWIVTDNDPPDGFQYEASLFGDDRRSEPLGGIQRFYGACQIFAPTGRYPEQTMLCLRLWRDGGNARFSTRDSVSHADISLIY